MNDRVAETQALQRWLFDEAHPLWWDVWPDRLARDRPDAMRPGVRLAAIVVRSANGGRLLRHQVGTHVKPLSHRRCPSVIDQGVPAALSE
jgi:hypothetical protein